MSLKAKIEADLKQALLSGDKQAATTLRGLKSAILNEEISKGQRENGLSDEAIITCLQKESKKRSEAIELYKQAGSDERAAQETSEKQLIDGYLPAALSDDEIESIVNDVIAQQAEVTPASMGKIIGAVKAKTGGAADGAVIAQIVKSKLQKG